MRKYATIFGLLLLSLAATTRARMKLVALPEREAVTVRLDNPAATLVQEQRTLTLQKGTNHIDFSWKGVRIDPNSIRIRMLSHPEKVRLISVSYPPGEDALVWQIYSGDAWQEKVRISYLLSGIDRLVTYKATADRPEGALDLKSYLVLRNFSGEDFQDARYVLDYGEPFRAGSKHEETRRILFFRREGVPIQKKFTWDAARQPHEPKKQEEAVGIPVEYVVQNSREAGLGGHALWGGKMRVYQQDGHGSTIFLGEDAAEFAPVGGKMEVYIGDSRDVVVTQRRISQRQVNIRRDSDGQIEVYDEAIHDRVLIENFRQEAVSLTVVEHIPGQWEPIEISHPYERKDHSTLEFTVEVPAGGEKTIQMQYRKLNLFAPRPWRRYNTLRD